MSNIELVKYEEFEEDAYNKAICIICVDGKYNIAYAQKVTKDGRSFWAPATFQVTKGGAKQYIDGFVLDSNKENEKLLEAVRQFAKNASLQKTSDVPFIQRLEASANEGLPF